jgi:molybdate/tungstate transport system substrate-binding protein
VSRPGTAGGGGGARRFLVLLGGAAMTLGVGGCASASPVAGAAARHPPGTVNVLYAGSLVRLMEQELGPRFRADTGYRFSGFAGGSVELANEIKGGLRRADVLVSASPGVDSSLEGAHNGDWVTWYVDFARSPLELGYNPHSRFAPALRRRPWYEVVTSPGFLLGRTDPVLDPKGALTVEALRQTARRTGVASLLRVVASQSGVFPEAAMVGRLEAGQLDAAFLYRVEADAAAIPTVDLAPVSLEGTFTVTIPRHAPDPAGALAFVRFLLGPRARPVLRAGGLSVLDPPRLHGTGAPGALRVTEVP